jgi:hypothetical protein
MVATRAKNKAARPGLPDVSETRLQKEKTGKTKKQANQDVKAAKEARKDTALHNIAIVEKATMEAYANDETPHPPKTRRGKRLLKRRQPPSSPSLDRSNLPSEPPTEFPPSSPSKKAPFGFSDESDLTEIEDTIKKPTRKRPRLRDAIDRMVDDAMDVEENGGAADDNVEQDIAMPVDAEAEDEDEDEVPTRSTRIFKRLRGAAKHVVRVNEYCFDKVAYQFKRTLMTTT